MVQSKQNSFITIQNFNHAKKSEKVNLKGFGVYYYVIVIILVYFSNPDTLRTGL